MAVFFALIAFFGWGIGDIIIAKTSRKIGSMMTFFWMLFLGTILLSLYIPFAPRLTDYQMIIFATVIGFIASMGGLYYFKGFEMGNVSIVGTIANSFGILTAIFGILLFGEKLKMLQLTGIFLAAIGLIFTSLDLRHIKKKKINKLITDKAVIYAFIAMICWSIYYTLVRIPIEKIGWFWAGYPSYWFFIILILLKKINRSVLNIFKETKLTISVITYTILVTIALFAYNLGLTYGYTSVVAPIAGSFPVLFVILSRFIFHDPLTRPQKAGIVLTLSGIVMIAFSSI